MNSHGGYTGGASLGVAIAIMPQLDSILVVHDDGSLQAHRPIDLHVIATDDRRTMPAILGVGR